MWDRPNLLQPPISELDLAARGCNPDARMVLSAPLLGVSPDAMAPLIGGSGRAKMVWDILRDGADPFASEAPVGKKLRAALEASFSRDFQYTVSASTVSPCGTRKLLLQLERGDAVETVVIPHGAFSTLCVSSQVGCRQACSFCATGTMGLLRSLRTEEILAQVHAAKATAARTGMPRIRNLVFMGMGEPADNLECVAPAIETLVHPFGFNLGQVNACGPTSTFTVLTLCLLSLGQGHVCLSTVGPSPQAIRALSSLPCRLAWSLATATHTVHTPHAVHLPSVHGGLRAPCAAQVGARGGRRATSVTRADHSPLDGHAA